MTNLAESLSRAALFWLDVVYFSSLWWALTSVLLIAVVAELKITGRRDDGKSYFGETVTSIIFIDYRSLFGTQLSHESLLRDIAAALEKTELTNSTVSTVVGDAGVLCDENHRHALGVVRVADLTLLVDDN